MLFEHLESNMMRRLAFAFGILLCGSIGLSAWPADPKHPKTRDAAHEAIDTVLRKEIFSLVDRRAELSAALEKHPDSLALHWQAGYVRHGKDWQPVEQFGQASADDSRLRDYRSRRAAAPR